jgi:hypothetical protein
LAALKAQVAGGESCVATVINCEAHDRPAVVLMRCQGRCDKCAVELCRENHDRAQAEPLAVDPRLRLAIEAIPSEYLGELNVLIRHAAIVDRVVEILVTEGGAGITPAVMAELRGIAELDS